MNIFILDNDPIKAAQYHNDKHCIKMILEHTQMLSTAIRVHSNDTNNANYIPIGPVTPFAQAMPDDYKDSNPVTAYRTYYLKDKKEFSKWKMGNTPDWFIV